MKALIFGINGQDGYYLSKICQRNGVEVIGVSRSHGNWLIGSVSDFTLVESLTKLHKPEYIFHLAANSTTKHSAVFENNETIVTGTLNILESVKNHSPKTKVFLSGSAMQFKNSGEPIDEQTEWDVSSPYAVSRIQSIYFAMYYRKLGLEIYAGYLFNHDSPQRHECHITQKIAKAVNRISNGSNEILEIGNIEVKKEFTFAGDVANAIWLLVNNKSKIYECVIGSGKAYSIKEWIEICCKKYKINSEKIVIVNKNFNPEYAILVSNPKLIFSLGWEPKIKIEQLAEMMLN